MAPATGRDVAICVGDFTSLAVTNDQGQSTVSRSSYHHGTTLQCIGLTSMCYSRAPRKPRTELPPFLTFHCEIRTAFLRRPPSIGRALLVLPRTPLPVSCGLPVARARHRGPEWGPEGATVRPAESGRRRDSQSLAQRPSLSVFTNPRTAEFLTMGPLRDRNCAQEPTTVV